MATNFKYASIQELTKYFNRVGDFDSKFQLFNPTTDTNLHTFQDTGYVDTLFINGEEIAAAQSTSNDVNTSYDMPVNIKNIDKYWFFNHSKFKCRSSIN